MPKFRESTPPLAAGVPKFRAGSKLPIKTSGTWLTRMALRVVIAGFTSLEEGGHDKRQRAAMQSTRRFSKRSVVSQLETGTTLEPSPAYGFTDEESLAAGNTWLAPAKTKERRDFVNLRHRVSENGIRHGPEADGLIFHSSKFVNCDAVIACLFGILPVDCLSYHSSTLPLKNRAGNHG